MAKINFVLSQRRGGDVVLPVLRAEYDAQKDAVPAAGAATIDIVATSDAQIWEVIADVPVRILFDDEASVTAATGRMLAANTPYTFAASKGQKPSVMLAS